MLSLGSFSLSSLTLVVSRVVSVGVEDKDEDEIGRTKSGGLVGVATTALGKGVNAKVALLEDDRVLLVRRSVCSAPRPSLIMLYYCLDCQGMNGRWAMIRLITCGDQ